VLASYGSRGEIEPCVVVGRELLRRGHEVRMAVPPDLVGFAESAGIAAVAYGLELRPWMDILRDFWARFFGNFWKIQDLIRLWREVWEPVTQWWPEMSTTLTSLADGADLLLTGPVYQEVAANIAE
jgi:UDP:flavonoid glycosyltransferase YjiC (YdhE family)